MIGFTTGEEKATSPGKPIQKSIFEEYPDYDFDFADTQFKRVSNLFIVYAVIPVFWAALLMLLIMGTTSRLNKLKSHSPHIKYIQKLGGWKANRFPFIVDENRKWGLIDNSNFKLLIEPQYDSMKWLKKNKLIEVTRGHELFLIDIKGNRCI